MAGLFTLFHFNTTVTVVGSVKCFQSPPPPLFFKNMFSKTRTESANYDWIFVCFFRFLQPKRPDMYSFFPFSVGNRNCIGSNFAMNEIRVVICQLLRKFRFLPVDVWNAFHYNHYYYVHVCAAFFIFHLPLFGIWVTILAEF